MDASLYYRIANPSEIKDLSGVMEQWVASNNPKAQAWAALPSKPPYDPATETCQWVNGAWVVAPIVIPVPTEVPLWALREALENLNELANVDNKINALPPAKRRTAQNRWLYKPTIMRSSSIISALQQQLGWSDTFIDDLYKHANAIAQNPN